MRSDKQAKLMFVACYEHQNNSQQEKKESTSDIIRQERKKVK